MEEWETQQSGLTENQKAIKIGQLLNVKLIVTGKLNKFASGGWPVSAVMLDAETGITLKSERVRHEGKFFTLLDQKVPGLAMILAGLKQTTPVPPSQQPATQAAISTEPSSNTWRDPVTGMVFVRVAGGSFEMGCHSGNEGECDGDEKPVRTVRLSPFWLGKHEVTQGQWNRIMGNNSSTFKKGDNYPVEQVSWDDVQTFIRKLNARSSVTFRLLSEAQWEYACRAGGTPLKYGTATGRLTRRTANYGTEDCCKGDSSDGHLNTSPVGSYDANGLGLHDMTGNVWEWVQDIKTSYDNVGTDNPIYEGSGASRVNRGGGWNYSPQYLRCSFRYSFTPSRRDYSLGFRFLRTEN